jgi:hypothetical protein
MEMSQRGTTIRKADDEQPEGTNLDAPTHGVTKDGANPAIAP